MISRQIPLLTYYEWRSKEHGNISLSVIGMMFFVYMSKSAVAGSYESSACRFWTASTLVSVIDTYIPTIVCEGSLFLQPLHWLLYQAHQFVFPRGPWGFLFPHFLNIICCSSLDYGHSGMRWNLKVIFLFSLEGKGVEDFRKLLPAIWIFSFENFVQLHNQFTCRAVF